MASIKVKFRPSTVDGHEGKIYYQIIHNRTIRQWATELKIFSEEWDESKSKIKITADDTRSKYLSSVRERIRWDIDRFIRIINTLSQRQDDFTADNIIEEFELQIIRQSFFTYMELQVVRLKSYGKIRTSQTYTTALNAFRLFRQNRETVFDAINSGLIESYQAYLMQKGLIPNSISFHMRILRAVYNRAVEDGLTPDNMPFRRVYTGVDKTAKRAVTLKTIKKIKDVNLSKLPKVAFARDIFMLSFYLRGMSFVDMAFLRKTDLHDGFIVYRRRKTGQQLSIKWTRDMQAVLDRYPRNDTEYLLPIITSEKSPAYNQYRSKQYLVNKWLKKVAEKIGIKIPLSMYCSRHSWASIAKTKGIPVSVISDSLGHESELTTQIYLSTLDTSAVDKANDIIMRSL